MITRLTIQNKISKMIPNIEGKSERYTAFNDWIHFATANIN